MTDNEKAARIAELRQAIADVYHGKRDGDLRALVAELTDLQMPAHLRHLLRAR